MPKNMKYDAVATKAAGPKKKMKTNQDGGSMTAKDPGAAGKEMAANQAGAAKYKEGPAMGHKKGSAKMMEDGPGKMGYSQKFGPGRMNGYDAGAKKVMDVMTFGGASKYMEKGGAKMMEGPAQGRSGLYLGQKIREGTADNTYSPLNNNVSAKVTENFNPNTGNSSTTTSYSSSDLPSYKANVTENYNQVSTNTSRYPTSNVVMHKDNKELINKAANGKFLNPSEGRGFQKTYHDGVMVRDTKTGKQLYKAPKKGEKPKHENIKAFNKHKKDSVIARKHRVRKQVYNSVIQKRSEIAKETQKQRGR